jgi:hypothetical protein
MVPVNRMSCLSWIFGGVAASGVYFAGLVAATAAEPQRGALSVCAGELSSMCGAVEAGNGKKMRCLLQNQDQLSADCDAAVKIRMQVRGGRLGEVEMAQAQPAQMQPAPPPSSTPAPVGSPKLGKSGRINKKACKAELATLCSTTAGSRTKCLIANEAKLGPECAAAVAVSKQTREVAKAACVTDAAKLCGTARGAERMQCLEANKPKLTPACLARVEKKEARQAVKGTAPTAPAAPTPAPPAGAPAKAAPKQ